MVCSKRLLVRDRAGGVVNGRGRVAEKEGELSTIVGRDD